MSTIARAGTVSAEEIRRLRWRCRRGLLENDLVLERFLAAHGASLDPAGLAALNTLLDLDDNTLWDLIAQRADFPAGPARDMLARLRTC